MSASVVLVSAGRTLVKLSCMFGARLWSVDKMRFYASDFTLKVGRASEMIKCKPLHDVDKFEGTIHLGGESMAPGMG